MDHPFRSAALGGFNRQDVMNYLEEQAKQAAQEQEQLHSRIDQAGARAQALEQKLEQLRGQLELREQELQAACQERDSLSARLDEVNAQLSASRAQLAQSAQELDRARAERDQLQAKVDELAPGAQAYAALKERTAGMELEAHRRAQIVQEQAQADARRLRRQTEQWFQTVAREYEALRSRVQSAAAHTAGELGKAGECLERVGRLMADQNAALDALRQACAAGEHKAEAPTPIPEKE